jgi:hypothetical protein
MRKPSDRDKRVQGAPAAGNESLFVTSPKDKFDKNKFDKDGFDNDRFDRERLDREQSAPDRPAAKARDSERENLTRRFQEFDDYCRRAAEEISATLRK